MPAHPMPVSDRTQARAWLTAERHNLLAALHHTARHGLHQQTLHLAASLRVLGRVGSSWETALDAANCGIAAARHSTHRLAEAWFVGWRGRALAQLRRWD